jgi:predicted RNase H-like nuclease (RuvC/YqgF family)
VSYSTWARDAELVGATLNWRRDPDDERRMNALSSDSERIKKETEQLRSESAQLKQETEPLRQQNAKGRQPLASIEALCFADDFKSTPAPPTPADTAPSSF